MVGRPKLDRVDVMMLGPSGVGKTSLLAAMYEQFAENVHATNLTLVPDKSSHDLLEKRLRELRSIPDAFVMKGWMPGTKQGQSFHFRIGKNGNEDDGTFVEEDADEKSKDSKLAVCFHDFPGGDMSSDDPAHRRRVLNLLREARAVFVAIDTPALLERGGKWHDKVNQPARVTRLFQEAYGGMDSETLDQRLVVFCPLRCERYAEVSPTTGVRYKNQRERRSLGDAVEVGYASLMRFFQESELFREKVALVVTPVQTIGGVRLTRVEENKDENASTFYFRHVGVGPGYGPVDTDQPLRYLLRFILQSYVSRQETEWGPFKRMRRWFGVDEELVAAAQQFANGCKLSEDFRILQGDELLGMALES